ncbi:MAG: phosphotransferase [Actinomycetota bacterium]
MTRMLALPRASRVVDETRARMRGPSIAPDVIREVLAACGLTPRGRAHDLGGGRSRNVVVGTGAGPKVVKRYRDGWAPETIAYGHSILDRLAALGEPAPWLVRTADGRTQIEVNGDSYAVFDRLPGRTYTSTYLRRTDRSRLMTLAGATLQRWHEALDGFQPEGRHHMGFAGLEGPRARGLDWYRSTVEDLRHDRVGSPRLVAEGPSLLDRIAGLDDALGRLDLPRRVIHGDFGLHNLMIHRGVAAPVDVELSRIDWRVTDLLLIVGKHLDGGEPDVELLAALFEAYGGVDEVERAGLGDAWRYQCATSAVRSWVSVVGSADAPVRIAAAHRSLDRSTWAEEHPDVLSRLFRVAPVTRRAAHA